ncbi:hypothetical protein OX284_016960 [Flavobacterium sp. SUN046]|uniref:hypothetical protein n=1 Tax=Flavobacterium sp. SUN046 TaxID=3002440 RepID=UPI002DBD5C05|nr:hypothetical protein [Flavobacterium sp. SUN046]MEC4051128.1 hypothetical protein [Flavobacterium sp. SUN046]
MKKNILIIFSVLFFISCNAQKELYSIECISVENEGFVRLKLLNYVKPTKFKVEEASKDAIKALLYSGYSSTNCPTQRPLLKETTDIDNFKKIEKDFFSKNGKWKTFIRNSLDVDNVKTEKITIKEFEIMVNKDLLRKYLEEQKIIKSLNTGF